MGLTTETDAQYYAVTQSFLFAGGSTNYISTLGEELSLGGNATTWAPSSTPNPNTDPDYSSANFYLETSPDGAAPWTLYDGISYTNPASNGSTGVTGYGDGFSIINNGIVFFWPDDAILGGTLVNPTFSYYFRIRLKSPNYGSYAYITINDIINNFLVAYVGTGKLIPNAKRTDIMFHAQRGVQEFSYDTLKSVKSQELVVPPSLSIVIPKDYVNYVKISRIDDSGVKNIIYPTRLTINPGEIPVQDDDGIPTQDQYGSNRDSTSVTEERWGALEGSDPNYDSSKNLLGQRFGIDPETAQTNHWFTINEREGTIMFSSGLSEKLIVLEYISDGITCDGSTRIPKLAEEAMYMHIAHSILSGRANIPEYVVQRFKKDRRSALRNAKIRLSNIKLEEIMQVFRGKTKQIK
ncbi:hypothetical protein CMI37_18155 [Candidatus Pacearchaeota archaeon]|mgnify:CR=1 FL=1|nr:hypothetical protein [Candidatus Pacearchaeota archaeon]|tara:strand:+ start:2061 stop:3284 length:1224 start_codon:yes stop_codon:yes gene_type:complete